MELFWMVILAKIAIKVKFTTSIRCFFCFMIELSDKCTEYKKNGPSIKGRFYRV